METNNNWEKDFVEKGAELEHIRWANWQEHFFDKHFNLWKESNRKEARTYLPLIQQLLQDRDREITNKILLALEQKFAGASLGVCKMVDEFVKEQGSNCLQKPYNIHRNRLKTLAFYY